MPRHGHVELGDFARRVPSLDDDPDAVYDALVRRLLRPRLAALGGEGLVLGIDKNAGWFDVLPPHTTVELELPAATAADWVVVDRRLQHVPDPALALQEAARRLRPGAGLVTLFTGIARPEPEERAPLWTVVPHAARRLHEQRAELEQVEVEQRGNVTLALASLYRLPAGRLSERELAAVDASYPVLVAVTASRRS